MSGYKIKTETKKLIGDMLTPVGIYLKLRDKFPKSILLESSDYHGDENSFSYICCSPILGFQVKDGNFIGHLPQGQLYTSTLTHKYALSTEIEKFCKKFEQEKLTYPFIYNGLFGYTSYNAVEHFEDIRLKRVNDSEIVPMQYYMYELVIAINHFNDELYLFKHTIEGISSPIQLVEIDRIIHNESHPSYHFSTRGEESTNVTDEEFRAMIQKGKDHCYRGDVFQIVLSRRFTQGYQGDDFVLYRALRSINPSPYLFYFDFGDFRIFGSSPEAQLIIKNQKSTIHPIAGTFRRTGHDDQDKELAFKLLEDPKENAEHVMLVDLARNDLSRSGHGVHVETYREVQYYSHVLHLVSKVSGYLEPECNKFQVIADTFPAGTLTGAPKHMAMSIIDRLENLNRGYYGGCIGFMDFEGNFNQAIMIRSFFSKNHVLTYQAGAGVVADSVVESELQEVNNKLAALKTAIKIACTI